MRKCRVNMSGLCLKLGFQDDAGLHGYGQSVRLVGSPQLDTSTHLSLCTNVSRLFVVAQVYVVVKPPQLLKLGGSVVCLYSSLSHGVEQRDVWLKLLLSPVLHWPTGTVKKVHALLACHLYVCAFRMKVHPWRVPDTSPVCPTRST